MQAGAEFVLVQIEKESDEPIEKDGLVLLQNNPDVTISAEVLHVGDYVTADVKKGGKVWFNRYVAQLVMGDMYAVADKAILAFE